MLRYEQRIAMALRNKYMNTATGVERGAIPARRVSESNNRPGNLYKF